MFPVRALGAVAVMLVLLLIATPATEASAGEPALTARAEVEPADGGAGGVEPVDGGAEGVEPVDGGAEEVGVDEAAPADDPGSPAGRSISWVSTPSNIVVREGQVTSTNPLKIEARVSLRTVVGGHADLEWTPPGSVNTVDIDRVRIPGTMREWTVAFYRFSFEPRHSGRYRIVTRTGVGNSSVSTTDFPIRVQLDPPVFSWHPQDKVANHGESVSFDAYAYAPHATDVQVSQQLQVSTDDGRTWADRPSTFTATADLDGALVRFVAYRSSTNNTYVIPPSAVYSNTARLTVRPAPAVPTIISRPLDTTVTEGTSATFTASATGSPEPTVQWHRSSDAGRTWQTVPGATQNALTLDAVPLSADGDQVRVTFTNEAGWAMSSPATLSVVPATPVITRHPSSTSVLPGQTATFSAEWEGTGESQWQQSDDGGDTWVDADDGTEPTLVTPPTTIDMDQRLYRVVVSSGPVSAATSEAATLTVLPTPPSAHLSVAPQVRLVDALP